MKFFHLAQSREIRFSWLHKAAELGDVDAIAEVGESFWGDGVTQDVILQFYMLKKRLI